MEAGSKKQVIALGVRIGLVFLSTVIIVILASYYVLSQNIQVLLTDYTINMMETMNAQGVQLIEAELDNGKKEALFMSDLVNISESGEVLAFPEPSSYNDYVRFVYVTETSTITTDGSNRSIVNREDIKEAFDGNSAIYGPYFNEENEYVICYSAPVIRNNQIIGVLSIEKDGYRFCDVIGNTQFVDSGESYIINASGTDIAVSNKKHIEWVNEQYNSQELYAQNKDEETKSILDLEFKGLNGESGNGTYYRHNGLCYLVYDPIPSTGWVMLTGLKEEKWLPCLEQRCFIQSKVLFQLSLFSCFYCLLSSSAIGV